MASKYNGIDERQIKCCDPSETTIEAGISFDTDSNGQNILNFHFLQVTEIGIDQKTKSMWLNKENTKELINSLRALKFKKVK